MTQALRSNKVLLLLFILSGVVFFGWHSKTAQAQAICNDNPANRLASSISNEFPRGGMARNQYNCAVVPAGDIGVLHSTYYYQSPSSYSTLFTDSSAYNVFYYGGRPTVAQQVIVWRINTSGEGNRCNAIGNGIPEIMATYNRSFQALDESAEFFVELNIPSDDFNPAPEYGQNVWKARYPVMVFAQPVSTRYYTNQWVAHSCATRIIVNNGGVISFVEDTNPQAPHFESNQRFNQARPMGTSGTLGVNERSNLGPYRSVVTNDSGATQRVGAFALWSTAGADNMEYALRFRTDCRITSPQQIYLRIYDGDGTSQNTPPVFGQPNPLQGYDTAFKVFNERTGQVVLDVPNVVSSNDEYREYPMIVEPGTEYTWAWYNVRPRNGLQVWLPFSEAGTNPAAGQCGQPPSCTMTTIPAVLRPGQQFQVKFDVTTYGRNGIEGYVIGSNSARLHEVPSQIGFPPGTSGWYPNETFGSDNYLVKTGYKYIRMNQAVSVVGGANASYTFSRYDLYDHYYNNSNGNFVLTSSGSYPFTAPSAPGTYEDFNFGFVVPNIGWSPTWCDGRVVVESPPAQPSCSISTSASSEIEPGTPFDVTVTVSNSAVSGGQPFSWPTTPLNISNNSGLGANINNAPYEPSSVVAGGDARYTILGVTAPRSTHTLTAQIGSATCTTTVSAVSRPYFRAVGDILSLNGTIKAWNSGPTTGNGKRGSATQRTIMSAGAVSGVRSNVFSNDSSVKSRTFANNDSEVWGGNFGTPYSIAADRYIAPQSATPITNSDLGTLTANGIYKWDGNITLPGVNLSAGRRLVLFVAGNVTISGNVTTPASYSSINDISRLQIIASGDITINSSVSRVDAELYARGTLYTCQGNGLTLCDSRVRINGLLSGLAGVRLFRTNGTLKDSSSADGLLFSNSLPEFVNTHVAEFIVADPWAMLAPGSANPTDSGRQYNSYRFLAPRL